MIWREYFGPIGVNFGVIVVGLIVFIIGVYEYYSKRETCLFKISCQLFLVGILYFTLHGRLLQIVLPIQLPEKPLVDNILTINYTLTSILTFIFFPLLLNLLMRNDTKFERLGLKVASIKKMVKYTFLGLIFNIALFLTSNTFFGYK